VIRSVKGIACGKGSKAEDCAIVVMFDWMLLSPIMFVVVIRQMKIPL